MKVLSWTFTKYSSKFHAWITRLSQTLLTRLASCAVLPLQAFTSSPRWLSSFSHMTDCGFLPSGLLQDSHWPLLKCIKANLCLEYNEPSQTTILSPTPTPCSKPFSKILLHVLPHGHGELLIDFFFLFNYSWPVFPLLLKKHADALYRSNLPFSTKISSFPRCFPQWIEPREKERLSWQFQGKGGRDVSW